MTTPVAGSKPAPSPAEKHPRTSAHSRRVPAPIVSGPTSTASASRATGRGPGFRLPASFFAVCASMRSNRRGVRRDRRQGARSTLRPPATTRPTGSSRPPVPASSGAGGGTGPEPNGRPVIISRPIRTLNRRDTRGPALGRHHLACPLRLPETRTSQPLVRLRRPRPGHDGSAGRHRVSGRRAPARHQPVVPGQAHMRNGRGGLGPHFRR